MFRKGNRGRVFLSIILVITSANIIKSTIDVLGSKRRLEEAKEKEQALLLERDEILKRIEYKKTSEYVEESARNSLNMIKPGEKVYVIEGGEVESATDEKVNEPAEDKSDPNWYLWYRLFF